MPNDEEQAKPQSPELAGGAGFTFESAVGAYYLAALLGEGYGAGVSHRTVSRVAFQQRNFGEPLDDVIVDFLSSAGEEARLSLQVKTDLTISAAQSNKDFRDIVRDSWLTYKKTDFRKSIDRYGAAVANVAKDKARALRTLGELARASDTSNHFDARFAEGGNASAEQKTVKDDIVTLLTEVKGSEPSPEEVHAFLAHLVLIEFDFMHAGATHTAEAMNRLRECLAPAEVAQAPALWSKLTQLARESAGRAGAYDRLRLLRELDTIGRLRGVASLRADLDKVTALARSWIADIQDDVGGVHLERRSLADLLTKAVDERRFIQIVGLPGSGKSVLLRQQVETDLVRGHVLFLKSDRLEGKSWSSFAAANSLSSAPLANLLGEIAATGSATLYIDGIDRVEKNHRPIVLDVLRAIVRTPELSNWKVVVSLRDSGIEPLRNWLSEVLNSVSIGTVEVGSLNDDEAEVLANQKPELRPLLFGPAQVSEVVRRPFFTKVLYQSFSADQAKTRFQPQSEVDLIENWWERGGYSATGQEALDRQRAILDVASVRSRQLSLPIQLSQLKSESVRQIEGLVEDGILQYVRKGHTVRFSHDIFFEWSFFHVLVERGDQWLDEIRACGEPPAVGRVVELLSQWEFREGKNWATSLDRTATAKMRSQWTRAWLLGPLGLPTFASNEDQFANAVSADDFTFLKRALVWLQAEKTVPNPNILASTLPVEQRIRTADFLGWPSDFAAWRRFIAFLLRRLDRLPVSLYPQIVSVFEVWQNAFAGFKNPVSAALLKRCADWLREIDVRDARMERFARLEQEKPSRWQAVPELDDFRQSICQLILRSASSMPELTEEYLKEVLASEDIRDEKYREIITFAPTLAATHPGLLVDLTLKHLKEELPDDRSARERREIKEAAEFRRRVEEKSESERTPAEKRMLSFGGPHFHHFHQFSYHDWESLCIERGSFDYWPPSPLREPFHSLLKASPKEALRLFTALCNHAMEAWRQLHRHDYDRQGTPIPLELHFPWGVQQFWGGDREYLWHRGTWAPHALASGFLAVEEWCYSEIESGRHVDDVIREVVEGNQSVGVLGIAVSLILHTSLVSEAAFPIVMAQRLWYVDLNRMVNDTSGSTVSLIGFKQGDEAHVAEIKKAAERRARRTTLRWLLPAYVFSQEFGERTKEVALAFKDNLPFQYEEHRNNPQAREYLLKQATENAEVALRENYTVQRSAEHEGLIEIAHVSPSASKPENVEKLERANRSLRQSGLWTWALRCFEAGAVGDAAKVTEAIVQAKELDTASLFESGDDQEELETRRGAVAGAAAVALRFREGRSDEELEWARDVIKRAFKAPEVPDETRVPQAIIPWHHGIFVAHGLASEMRRGTADTDAPAQLLVLVTHPLENVSLAALAEIVSLWEVDAKLVWAALHLSFDLCRIGPFSPAARRGPSEPIHPADRTLAALTAAAEYYEKGAGWLTLPLPPPAWIKRERTVPQSGDGQSDDGGLPDIDFGPDDVQDARESWAEPKTHWYSQYAAKVLALVPFEKILLSDAREEALGFVDSLLAWTNAKNAPPWLKKRRRDRDSARLIEWTHQLGRTLGDISGDLSVPEVKTRFLEPIFALEGDTCWSLLTPFADRYICRYIYDAPTVPDGATDVVRLCLDRFLQTTTLQRSAYRSGEFHGFDEPQLSRILMFVAIEHAGGAARYVNGDWSEVAMILPLIDRYVRAAGWSVSVMVSFLTLCERAKNSYPAEMFADQVLAVIADESQPVRGWHGTFIPARIAGLVQFFADRETPMPSGLGQKLLRILDLLVDMGDRRSAALQMSEAFREITLS